MITRSSWLSRVVVVGGGRLGGALAHALAAAGVSTRALRGRGVHSANDSEDSARTEAGVLADASLVILAVPDGAIEATARRLASAVPREGIGAALHLSGLRDASVLSPLREAGLTCGSCHPLQTFPSASMPSKAFQGIVFTIEGDPGALEAARDLVGALGGRPAAIAPGKKPLYHLAAALAANGTVALLGAARDAMRGAGFPEADALLALAPLLRAALENALREGPEKALTGPVARGDRETLAAHRSVLRAWDASRLALYEALVAEQERLCRQR
jgi:predicted short-subunit dehydrogenase-like oxidoreductase (DUF2520 family)